MKRYVKFVLEAEEGITFEVSEGTSKELVVKAVNDGEDNSYSINYENPSIPEGYKHVCGEWNNGFVIEREIDGSQFVWVPVGSLKSNGTLDGDSFTEKFGRRNFCKDEFSKYEFNEPLIGELELQFESVKKYGGFYFSRFEVSKNEKKLMPQSVKGVKPLQDIDFATAREIAAMFEESDIVTSHLPFGAEYDSVLEWLIESGAKTYDEIAKDSTNWGNYSNNCYNNPRFHAFETGKVEQWSANNIFDLAGNLTEWTQELGGCLKRVLRGGGAAIEGSTSPAATRESQYRECNCPNIGFRVALYIK